MIKAGMLKEERDEKLKSIKEGHGAAELMVQNSFEKQQNSIQFIEYMSKHYSKKQPSEDIVKDE